MFLLCVWLMTSVQLSFGYPPYAPFPDGPRVEQPAAVRSESFDWIRMVRHPSCVYGAKPTHTIFVPVYYMSTHNVALDCAACTNDQIYNGEVKVWRSVLEIDLFTGIRNVMDMRQWRSLFEALESIGESEERANVPVERRTRMNQVGSRLYLMSGSMFGAGLYNCYPEGFAFEPRQIVYLVMPMVYPLRFEHLFAYDTKTVDFNTSYKWWPFRGSYLKQKLKMFTGFVYPVTHVRDQTNPPWNELLFPIKLRREMRFEEMSQRVSLNGLLSMNLKLELNWEEWSACSSCRPYRSLRTRQGHCYLKRNNTDKPIRLPQFVGEDMGKFYGTMRIMRGVVDDLNILFNQNPFYSQGIRCWSIIPLLAGSNAHDSPCTEWTKHQADDTVTQDFLREWAGKGTLTRLFVSEPKRKDDKQKLERKFGPLSGCLIWFHNLFHAEFSSTDFQAKWANFFFPQTAEEVAPADWNRLINQDRISLRKMENQYNTWLRDVNRKLPPITKSGYVPLCGSAGYFIDFKRCSDHNCSNILLP